MNKSLSSLLALILFSSFCLTSLAEAKPLKATELTNESVSSLLAKGDNLSEKARQTDRIEEWIWASDAYLRAWLQANQSELSAASFKYASTRLEIGDDHLNNDKNLEGALNCYLSGLALTTYPALNYKQGNSVEEPLNLILQERTLQAISRLSLPLKTVDDHIQRANKLIQEGHTISALGQFVAAQQLGFDDSRLIQGIQKCLDMVNQRRTQLNQERNTLWVANHNDIDIRKLVGYLEKRIKHRWMPPEFSQDYSGSVMFKVNPDGTLSNITIRDSSKNIDFDASMIRTVEKSSPIPAKVLKKAIIGQNYLHVLEKFEYRRNDYPY